MLELFDRVYQAWMMANSSDNFVGPVVSNSATSQSWYDFIAGLQKTPGIFLNRDTKILKDYLFH